MADQMELDVRVENDVERADREGHLVLFEGKVGGERYVSVISKPRGGQIRGYRVCERGCAHLALPDYVGPWPELDAWVAKKLGVTISDRGVFSTDVCHPAERRHA